MKRSRVLLVIILVAVAVLCYFVFHSLWVNEGPLWRIVMLKEIDASVFDPVQGFVGAYIPRRGISIVLRWTDPPKAHGRTEWFYVSNGFKAQEVEYRYGLAGKSTVWSPDGRVGVQSRPDSRRNRREHKTSAPWWWGVTDRKRRDKPAWSSG